MVGSRRMLSSMALAFALAVMIVVSPVGSLSALAEIYFGGDVVPSIQPSCSDLRQKASKSAPVCCFCQ